MGGKKKKKTTASKRTEGNFYLPKKCDIAYPVTWVRMLGAMSRYKYRVVLLYQELETDCQIVNTVPLKEPEKTNINKRLDE